MRIALIAALSLLTVTPAFATEGAPGSPGDNNGRAERVATEGPGNPTDSNGRAKLATDPYSTVVTEGPGSPTDGTGRAELTTDPHLMVAGGRGGIGGEF